MHMFKIFTLFLLFSYYGMCLSERPKQVETWSHDAYMAHARRDVTSYFWGLDGTDSLYFENSYNENNIVSFLLENNQGAKDIYVVDLGAGRGARLKNFADFINSSVDVDIDVTFHLINFRAEKYVNSEQVIDRKCVIYNFGNVEIENIDQELIRLGLEKTKFALVLSRWTFVHFVDPLRPFLAMYDRLSENGIMLVDSFKIPTIDSPFSPAQPFLLRDQLPLFNVLKLLGCDFAAIVAQEPGGYGLPFIIRRGENVVQNQFKYDEKSSYAATISRTYQSTKRAGYDLGNVLMWPNFSDIKKSIDSILTNPSFNPRKTAITPSEEFFNILVAHKLFNENTHGKFILTESMLEVLSENVSTPETL